MGGPSKGSKGKGKGKGGKGSKGAGKAGKGSKKGADSNAKPKESKPWGKYADSKKPDSKREAPKDAPTFKKLPAPTDDQIQDMQHYTGATWHEMRDSFVEEHGSSRPTRGGRSMSLSDLKNCALVQDELSEEACRDFYTEKATIFEAILQQDEEQRWLSKVAVSGTMSDRIASLTTKIRLSPLFALNQIRSLVLMAGARNRQEAGAAVEALKKLFAGDDVLPDRTLKEFDDNLLDLGRSAGDFFRNGGKPDSAANSADAKANQVQIDKLKIFLHFEDSIKVLYTAFVNAVIQGAQDNVSSHKTKCIEGLGELYSSKPELENVVLENIVNKFGDTDKRIGSSLVARLLAKEVQRFVQGKITTLSTQAKYNAVGFLSELTFTKHYDMQLAMQLVCFYSVVLKHVFCSQRDAEAEATKGAGKKGGKGSKGSKGTGKGGKKGKGKGTKGKDSGKGEKGDAESNETEEKKQSAEHVSCPEMENRLVRAAVTGIKRALPYLSPEVDMTMFEAMSENFFEICHTTPSYATRVSMLALLQKILTKKGELTDRFFRLFYDQVGHFQLYGTANRKELLDLTKDVVLSDSNVARAVAFLRRIAQVSFNIDSVVSAAAVLLIGGLLRLRRSASQGIVDGHKEAAETEDIKDKENTAKDSDAAANNADAEKKDSTSVRSKIYDPIAREPKFAAADQDLFWEMHSSFHHVDPTVRALGKSLGQPQGALSHLRTLDATTLSGPTFLDLCALEKTSGSDSADAPTFKAGAKVVPHEEFLRLYMNQDLIAAKRLLRAEQRRKRDQILEDALEVAEGEAGGEPGNGFVTNDHAKEAEEDAFFDQYIEDQMGEDEEDDFSFSGFSDAEREDASEAEDDGEEGGYPAPEIGDSEAEEMESDEDGDDDGEGSDGMDEGGSDSEGGDGDFPHMLDDDDEDMSEEAGDDAEEGSESGESDEEEKVINGDKKKKRASSDSGEESTGAESNAEGAGKKRRKLSKEQSRKLKKAKALVQKHSTGSIFAAADDFEEYLDM